MKKSYSQWNVLQEKLNNQKDSFLEYFFTSKYRYIEIKLPYYEYLRGEVFCQDFIDLFEEAPYTFSVKSLMSIIFKDFLTQIKKGTNYESMARFLVENKYKYIDPPKKETRVLKQVNTNLFSFETNEEEVAVKEENSRTAYLTIKIQDKMLLRGEIFLHDLSPFLHKEQLQIEELFAILYLDFIAKVKEKGNNVDVMKAILNRIT
ncbi:hypothetical protein ACFRCQ_24625 [Cytobacillus firmus]|uniref:Uncharacterized protein n=1 Tax=Cytobacillus oceanisediminis TaxID=665099 RepID=A0ABX3CK97_9BACI|nr:hypothetical protein [Cytobacillus oceanisediminis]OHX41400.1 hypothetical protein BBV17_28815 [Cytobacillus oceanisediminis]